MWRTSAVFVIPFAMCVAPSAFKNVISPIRSPYLHQLRRDSHLVFNAKSPMFMRVRRTVPQFTFILSERFVNHKSSVSTGFFRVFPVLFVFGHIFSQKTQQNRRNLFLQRLCLTPILSQDQVRDIALIVLEKLNLRIERGRKKTSSPTTRAWKTALRCGPVPLLPLRQYEQ
jgi:hypothetical protein